MSGPQIVCCACGSERLVRMAPPLCVRCDPSAPTGIGEQTDEFPARVSAPLPPDAKASLRLSAGSADIGKPLCLYDGDGNPVALMNEALPFEKRAALALRIARSVNAHDDLVAALRDLHREVDEGVVSGATLNRAARVLAEAEGRR